MATRKKASAPEAAPAATDSPVVKRDGFTPSLDGVAVVAAREEPSLDPEAAAIRDAEIAKLVAVTVEPRPEPTIDPELMELREDEVKALSAVTVSERAEPTIDPVVEKARDAEIKRQADALAAAEAKNKK